MDRNLYTYVLHLDVIYTYGMEAIAAGEEGRGPTGA